MRKIRNSGNFFLCLLINILLNLEWTIPAWVLLVLHYMLDWSIWWFWGAIGIWILDILVWMWIMRWASRGSSIPKKPKENKNPYSVGAKQSKELKNDR